ncbi:MAG TPA: penicillin acylase family protein [Solirubrobacteraceae bacterium]|nr:penicillin acylase family protein [Solirubrobacteraceae bacterium]
MRGGLLLFACAAILALPASAGARVVRSVSILPPGQSGFVSAPGLADGTGSPHLYDQTQPFIDFRWKPATFHLPGSVETPRAGIRIVRDSFGVPAVTGTTEQLMWRGAGYAMAQDRLFELELFRRATTGTLASIAGRERVPDDKVVRRNFYTAAELDRMFGALPAQFRQRFESYRDGVNDWIEHVKANPDDMPGEFAAVGIAVPDPWTVRDSVAIGVYLARTIPTNADPSSLELANLRGLQLGGGGALQALVPLRTPGARPTIPAREGRFPSQPGRTLRQERAALARSAAYARGLPFPAGAPADPTSVRALRARSPATRILGPGGSWMFAVRDRAGKRAWLYNGPQLGFTAPERVVELELHAPGFDARGMTAPGVPVLGNGHNGRIAWGITTGASDMDDLYAERTVPGEPESYRFRGAVRKMDCRNETIAYRSPPSTLVGLAGGRVPPAPESGSETVRVCRTHHGPVEARAGNVAYARRHASWMRELDTLGGLDALSRARNIREVDAAVRLMTWNENIMAADSQGSIGFWHPGLHPLRPRAWDERLPYPGTGEAEWRGVRSTATIPAVINPRQGWLANWNNVPSADWTSGDGTARKRMDALFFRVAALEPEVRALARRPSFAGLQDVVRRVGTVAQQRRPAYRRLLVAARPPLGRRASRVLNTLLAWDGSYHRTASDGTVHPGVATWDAFRAEAERLVRARVGPAAGWLANEGALQFLHPGYHMAAPYHYFEATHLESTGLRTLDTAGYRLAAERAFEVLARRFGSADPGRWREPRRMFDFQGLAGAQPPPLPFFDRGTFEQLIGLGP